MIDLILYTGMIFTSVYIFFCLYIFRGLRRSYRTSSEQPFISILVPARDEEESILSCLESLSHLTYPRELTEVIVLNDRSGDRTGEIITRFCKDYPHFKYVEISEDKDQLSGKMNVLAQGIDRAQGAIILVTDADCQVTPEWAEALVAHFTPDTGMVGGITMLENPSGNNGLFARLQALDWLFLQGIASGMTGAGRPVSILGNNFAFRRTAYDETGGFSKIRFSLTEDMVLMQAISKLGRWQIKYPLYLNTLLYSRPASSLKELYHQRLRWLSGGISGPLTGWFLMTTAFLTHLFLIICLSTGIPIHLCLGAMIAVLCADLFLIVIPLARRLKRSFIIKFFLFFEIYYFLYSTLLAFLIFLPQKVSWKKRRY